MGPGLIHRSHKLASPTEYPAINTQDRLEAFLEKAWPQFMALSEDYLLASVVRLYIEALQGDLFFETEGLRYVVIVEFILSRHAKLAGQESLFPTMTVRDFQNDFLRHTKPYVERFVRDWLREILPCESSERDKVLPALMGKFNNIVRNTLRRKLKHVRDSFGLHLSNNDIGLFIESRNSLVHEGIYWATSESGTGKTRCPFADVSEEAHFLRDFTSRLLLGLLGYAGHYLYCTNESASPPQ